MPTKTNTLARLGTLIVVLGARISSAHRSTVGATIVGLVAVLGAFCFPANAFAFDQMFPQYQTGSAFSTTTLPARIKNDPDVASYYTRMATYGRYTSFLAKGTINATTSIVANHWGSGVVNWFPYVSATSTITIQNSFSAGDGQYVQYICASASSGICSDPLYYFNIYKTGSTYTLDVSPEFQTAITSINVAGTTIASTTVDFEVTYFVNSSNFATSSSDIEVCLTADNLELITQLNPSANSFYNCEFATLEGSNIFSTTTVLNRGLYQGYATLLVNGEMFESKPFRFVVEGTTLIDQWPSMAGNASTTGGFFEACETEASGDITGYVQTLACWVIDGFNSVMSWLFMPSQTSTDRFATLSLRNKMPFEYGYQMGDIWDAFYTSNNGETLSISASTTLGTITFISADMVNAWEPIPSLIRTTLGAILWLLCAQWIWRRVQRIHDK